MSEVLVENSIEFDDTVKLYGEHTYVIQKCTSMYAKSVSSDKNIYESLYGIDLDPDVITEALKVYDDLGITVRRGKKWQMLLYYCIDTAYIRLGDPQDPKNICSLLNIPVTIASKVQSNLLNDNKSNIIYVTPDIFIDCYYNRLKDSIDLHDSDLNKMLSISKYVHDKIDDYPQVIAAAIIQYYCNMSGIKYDKKKIETIVHKSQPTISKIVKKIDSIIDWDI